MEKLIELYVNSENVAEWSRNPKDSDDQYLVESWYQTLLTKINQCSAQMHLELMSNLINPFTTMGGASVILTSNEIVNNIISKMVYYYPQDFPTSELISMVGYRAKGTLSARYTIYTHPDCIDNTIYIINPNQPTTGYKINII